MISESSIDEVRQMLNVVDVVGESVKLKKKGSDFVGLCPFHDEKTPSFTVSPSKQIYKCFGCGKSGDAIQFVIDNEAVSYIEAITRLAAKHNIKLELDANKEYVKPLPRLQKVSDKVLKFFESRGISNNTILRFGITETKEWMPQFEKETDVICFNYLRDAQLVNIKFRGPKKSFKLEKDAELIFYNLDAIKDSETATIFEGEIDCLSAYEAGIYDCVSVPNGAGKAKQNLTYLDNCIDYFKDKKKIVIFTDNDAPGRSLCEELGRRLGFERCKKVIYPSGCKDANEILMNLGAASLADVYDNSIDWPLEGILTAFDEASKVIDYYENGYPNGYVVPLPGFKDNVDLQLMLGQHTVVTGIPGSGKSEITDWIMIEMSKYHGWKWGVCSPENQPSSLHITKLVEKYCGKAFEFRKDLNNRLTRDQLTQALNFINDHFFFINIEETEMTLEGIYKRVEDLIFRKGIKGFLLDPWNKVEHSLNGLTETQSANKGLTFISSFCKRKQIHTITIAHPTKMPKDKDTKKYEVPTLYNISGSANWYNQVDNGLTAYRDRETKITSLHVQKVRFNWLGKEGRVDYRFNTFTRQFELDINSPRDFNQENTGFTKLDFDFEDNPF